MMITQQSNWSARQGAVAAFASVLTLAVLTGGAAAQSAWDRIQSEGRITVATEAAFPPFEFVEDGEIMGLGSDLLAEVVADMGVELEQLDLPFQGILAGLASGQYDLVATTVAINPERAANYAYTRPIGAVTTVVMVRVGNEDITDPMDTVGMVVGSQLGSAPAAVARTFEEEVLIPAGEGYGELRLLQTFPDVVFALAQGQIDAAIVVSTTAAEFMAQQPDQFDVVGNIGEPQYVAWVVRPEDVALREQVNGTLTRLIDSGEMAELHEQWLGFTMPTPADNYLPEGAIQLQ